MSCPLGAELEQLRAYKAETLEKLLAEKEADLVQLGKRCEILKSILTSQKVIRLNSKPLVTDNPTNNTEIMLNYAYAKDQLVHLRYANGEADVDLAEYICHLAAEKGCGTHTREEVLNGDVCLACDCEVAILATVAVQAAELRSKLKLYEEAEGKK